MKKSLMLLALISILIGCDNSDAKEESKVEYMQVPYCENQFKAAKQLLGFKLDNPNVLDSVEELYGKLQRWDINPNFADGNWMMEDSVEYFVATEANLLFKIRRIQNPDFLDLGYWQIMKIDRIQTTSDLKSEFLTKEELRCEMDPLGLFEN
jgi:hypothetical protein